MKSFCAPRRPDVSSSRSSGARQACCRLEASCKSAELAQKSERYREPERCRRSEERELEKRRKSEEPRRIFCEQIQQSERCRDQERIPSESRRWSFSAGEISWAKAQVNCFDELPAERCRPSKEKHQKSEKSRRVSYEQEIESRRDQVNHDLETIRESM